MFLLFYLLDFAVISDNVFGFMTSILLRYAYLSEIDVLPELPL